MCGIMGYSGFRDSKEVLLHGLEKIQYRGYDSMGLVTVGNKGSKRARALGDITQLKEQVSKAGSFFGFAGLAHSRWATHGAPSKNNAHPHKAGHIYIVHNGIVENAEELKAHLKGPFLSETDSEVIAHCLLDFYQKTGCLKQAVFDTFSNIKGECAVAIMSEKYPKQIFAFKKGPSLLVGLGEKELFLCSDVQGVLPYTDQVIFLRDMEVVHIQNGKDFCIYSAETKKKISRSPITLKADIDPASRGHYPYYMLKEIYEQPACISRLIQSHINQKNRRVDISLDGNALILDQIIQAGRLNIVACGSSYYSALYGKYVLEKFTRICVEVDMASEFRYRLPVLPEKSPVLLISQSGETADTLAVLKMARELLLPVLSLCNVAHSSLDRGADLRLYMSAGVEKGVASTKSFSSTLAVLFLLALFIGKKRSLLEQGEEEKYLRSFCALPSFMEELLSREQAYKQSAQLSKTLKSFVYLGRNVYYPLALEGALKMKELTYRHGSAYPAGEMKHGPLALVDQDMAVVGLSPKSHIYRKTLSNLQEARSRGGKLIVIGTEGDKEAKALSECFLPVPCCEQYLSAILCALPVQLMAYHTALALGHNVDQPRNLAKSVTVE